MSAPHRFLIVDGHSMVFAAGDRRRVHRDNQRMARDQLASALQSHQDTSGERVVLVFDGRGETREEPRTPGGIQVVYAGSDETADAVIERLLVRYAGKYDIRVATDDRLVQTSAAASGAQWLGSRTFAELLAVSERDLQSRIERVNRAPRRDG